jgi:hypothetical protein
MEFQSGDGAQLKPVKLLYLKNPASSYVTFNNKGAGEALSTWSLQITDEQGKISLSDLILKMKFVFPEKQF